MSKKTSENRSDDYPEIMQKDIDRSVKRKGLESLLEDKENPFDVLARHAIEESRAGRTVTLEDFERRMKKNVAREPVVKSAKGLKKT